MVPRPSLNMKWTSQELPVKMSMNIDQTLPDKLHGPTHCKLGATCVYRKNIDTFTMHQRSPLKKVIIVLNCV